MKPSARASNGPGVVVPGRYPPFRPSDVNSFSAVSRKPPSALLAEETEPSATTTRGSEIVLDLSLADAICCKLRAHLLR